MLFLVWTGTKWPNQALLPLQFQHQGHGQMSALLHSHFCPLWQDNAWDSVWHVRIWAVRMSVSLNASAVSLCGLAALNCQAVSECRMAFQPGIGGERHCSRTSVSLEISAQARDFPLYCFLHVFSGPGKIISSFPGNFFSDLSAVIRSYSQCPS